MAKRPASAADDDDDAGDRYSKHRQRMRNRMREQATDVRDLGMIPKVKNPKRRLNCERDLKLYCTTYFPDSFALEFSEDHDRILKMIETAILEGGLTAVAMPRGSGKTTILLRAAMWALSYGHRRFVALIEADGQAAVESMDVIKMEFETNEKLLEDFPEICVPIRALEGITQRANAQMINGERTLMAWTKSELILPTVRGSKASGATIRCKGITGRIRGMQKVTSDGKTLRPDFVLVNDPQTDLSARSEAECFKREKVLSGGILGLAGPGSRIAGFAAVTVIRENDVADRLLNIKLNPKWHGQRCKLVYNWPTDTELWDKYLELRSDEIESGDDTHPKATAFYRKNRKAMDVGSKVGWPARHFPHELSAIQHAFGLRADNPDTYDAEYDNTPKPEVQSTADLRVLSSTEFCLRVMPTHKRGEIPLWAEYLTLGVDVQETSLWWVLFCASQEFKGMIVDYGVWPDQSIEYTTLDQIDRTIQRQTKVSRPGDAIIEALRRLTNHHFTRDYLRDDGAKMPINRVMIDSGHRAEAIYRFCQETSYPAMPCKGEGFTAKNKPLDLIPIKKGEKRGMGYRIPPMKGIRTPRLALIDTNRWKTFACDCFAIDDIEAPGAWSLFRASATRHRMLADNLSSSYPTKTQGHGRTLYEWQLKPNRDNHLDDALIYAAVGAAISGAQVQSESTTTRPRRRRVISMPKAQPAASSRAAYEVPAPSKGTSKSRPKKTMAQLRAEAEARKHQR